MKERGIGFTADNLAKVLDGTKTQTRRVMKPQPCFGTAVTDKERWRLVGDVWLREVPTIGGGWQTGEQYRCPYGIPGDRLIVKEPWRAHGAWDDSPPRDICTGAAIRYETLVGGHYRYKDTLERERLQPWGRLRSARFMPYRFADIRTVLTDVRAERVQGISEEDAIAEGIPRGAVQYIGHAIAMFAELWDSINGKKPGFAWADNPWTWALTYRLLKTKDGDE